MKTSVKDILKTTGFFFHRTVSKSYFISRLYVETLGYVLRILPNRIFKKRAINSINSARWPDMDLLPRSVRVGSGTTIKIIPHFHQFDFESVVSSQLSYEKEIFDYLEGCLSNYDAIIEIGANVGVFSIFFSRLFRKHGKKLSDIFIFEPSVEAYRRLLKNIKINRVSGIQIFNCAVGEVTGLQDFFEPEGHLMNGTMHRDFAEIFSVPIRSSKVFTLNGGLLENLIDEDKRLLIKIDTEGSETAIIKSMKTLIETRRPALLVEVLPDYEDDLNGLEFLFGLGYKFFNITDKGLVKHQKFNASRFRDYILLPEVAQKPVS